MAKQDPPKKSRSMTTETSPGPLKDVKGNTYGFRSPMEIFKSQHYKNLEHEAYGAPLMDKDSNARSAAAKKKLQKIDALTNKVRSSNAKTVGKKAPPVNYEDD